MAALIADNNQASRVDEPRSKLNPADQHGRVRRAYDEITLSAELALNDTIDFMYLPKGATIIGAKLIIPADGTTGQLDIGYSGDSDALYAGASAGDFQTAVDANMAGTAAAYNNQLSDETLIQGLCVEASTASSGNKIQLEVLYIVD